MKEKNQGWEMVKKDWGKAKYGKRKVNKAKHQLSKIETKKIARNQKDIDIARRALYHIVYFVESIGE